MPSFSKLTFFALAAVAATSVTATPVVVRPGSIIDKPFANPVGEIKREVTNPVESFRQMRQKNPGFVGPREVSNPAENFRNMRQHNPGFVGPRKEPLEVDGPVQPPNSDKATPPPSAEHQPAQGQQGQSFQEMRKHNPGFVGPRGMPLHVDGPVQPPNSDKTTPPTSAGDQPAQGQQGQSFQEMRKHNPGFVGPRMAFKDVNDPEQPATDNHAPQAQTPEHPPHSDAHIFHREVTSPAKSFQEMRKQNPNFVGPRSPHAPHRGFRGPRYILEKPDGTTVRPQCKGTVCPMRRELEDLVARVMVESPDGQVHAPACKAGEMCAMRRELARAIAEFDARSVADELD